MTTLVHITHEITEKINSIFEDRFFSYFETCQKAISTKEISSLVALEMAITGAQCQLWETYKEAYDKLFNKYNDVLDLSVIYPEMPLPKLNQIYDSAVEEFRAKMDVKGNVIALIKSHKNEK
jgi:hypothetical protein